MAKHILSCSFGKDSIATALLALQHGEPLDELVYCEVMFSEEISGELPEHNRFIHETAIPYFEQRGIPTRVLRSEKTYLSCFYHVVTRGKTKGMLSGFPLSGRCTIQRDCKLPPIKAYQKALPPDTVQYIGIAADEPKRLARLKPGQISLLDKYHVAEPEARSMCAAEGLLSPLYDFTKRGGCWFCPNASISELRHLYRYHPELWQLYHANIRKALSDAAKLKLIPYNPAAEVERPKKDNFVASYYSADELMEVLPIFANTKMELPVMLAAFYGLRRSEVIGLQWSAIDFERKIVTISRTFERINVDGKMVDVSKCRTKNKASFRSLPLIPAVEQALLKAQKRQHQQMKLCGGSYCKEYKDYICVDDMGHLVTPDYVTRVFREMLLKNGFRPIRYHDLRHSCASLLIKNKVTMKEVQMWLGHSSFSTTANIYAHIDVDSKMEAANMIASKINLGELPEKKKSPKRKIA